jgi:hypothetical protein
MTSLPFQSRITAVVSLEGISPYSASRMHDEPRLEREKNDSYDLRTWRSHLHVNSAGIATIPAFAMHDCIVQAAKHSGKKIGSGMGQKTWSGKLEAGIFIPEDLSLGVTPDAFQMIAINAHANGQRGSGTRVRRHYPIIGEWSTTFNVEILDPIITKAVLDEMLVQAGMFIGLGRYRPQNRGQNGRFRVTKLIWNANHELELKEAA